MAGFLIYVKLHRIESGYILAMCDKELIGAVLDDGKVHIDVSGYSDFYKGELMDAPKALDAVEPSAVRSVNAIGRESVELAVSMGLIDRASALMVGRVPYAHAYRIEEAAR